MFEMLLGHLVGDYLLQNEFLALNKSKNTKIGWLAAFVHCILYTLAVCTLMWEFTPIWMLVVFLSHFPIDKFSLAEQYLTYIKGYGMRQYVHDVNSGQPHKYINTSPGNNMLKGGFTAVVYTITDNTMHLLLMYGAYQIIF